MNKQVNVKKNNLCIRPGIVKRNSTVVNEVNYMFTLKATKFDIDERVIVLFYTERIAFV